MTKSKPESLEDVGRKFKKLMKIIRKKKIRNRQIRIKQRKIRPGGGIRETKLIKTKLKKYKLCRIKRHKG